MAVHHVDLDDLYIPKTSNQDIFLSVGIGDGQSGSYSVFSGLDLMEQGADDRVKLGKKADIVNKDTVIIVTIRDTLNSTNWTSMTVTATEGGQDTQFGPYKVRAEKHLDTIVYSLKLVHK